MKSSTKTVVMVFLVAMACAAAYFVTKRDDASSKTLENGQPIILQAPSDNAEQEDEEHISGAWGEVVIKKKHDTDSSAKN